MQVRASKSGVGQYIHALMDSAVKLAPDDAFLIYCSRANEQNYVFGALNSKTRVWGLGGASRPVRLGYEYLFLPDDVKAQNLDVFHGASNFLPLRRVCPYVVTIHDLSYHVNPDRCPPVRRQYWYAMTRRTVQVADIIIADSENSRRDIIKFFPAVEQKIRVVSLAAHRRFEKLDIRREGSELTRFEAELGCRPYILYLGTLEPGKNVVRTVRAFDAIADQFPDHVLVLAGDKGWLYKSVFDAIENSKYRNRIHYLGHVSDVEAVHLYNFADLFVFPSLYEGFGLPPLEAMACGCPVVTSNSSSIPEVVGDAAILVDPQSEKELAAAMARVLSSDTLQIEMSQAGQDRAARFSWDKCAAETLAVYHEAASM